MIIVSKKAARLILPIWSHAVCDVQQVYYVDDGVHTPIFNLNKESHPQDSPVFLCISSIAMMSSMSRMIDAVSQHVFIDGYISFKFLLWFLAEQIISARVGILQSLGAVRNVVLLLALLQNRLPECREFSFELSTVLLLHIDLRTF